MATTVVSTIKASGGDYTSLANWEAGRQGDIITRDTIEVAECYAFSDTSTCHVNGWTTDATHWIEIRTPLSERHSGVWTNSKYRLEGTVTGGYGKLVSWEDNFRVYGLQVDVNINVTGIRGIFCYNSGVSDFWVANNIVKKSYSSPVVDQQGILFLPPAANAGVIRAWNNIVYDFGSNNLANSNYGLASWNGSDTCFTYYYNNTVYNCDRNIQAERKCYAKNNLSALGVADKCFEGYATPTFLDGSCNNASSDGTAPGTSSRINQTFTFLDAANKNFHLAAGDAGAKGFGVDLSGDASLPFSNDIDSLARVTPWDIGADQFMISGHPACKRFGGVPFVAINRGVW